MPDHKNIIIIDPHAFVREGMASILTKASPFLKIMTFDRVPTGSFIIAKQADLIVCDHGDNSHRLFELIQSLAVGDLRPRVMITSISDESVVAPLCIPAGANGFVSLSATAEEFVVSVNQLLAGETYFSNLNISPQPGQSQMQPFVAQNDVTNTLSRRELEVFTMLGKGLPVRNIAPRMGISVKTVETHRENIKHKLELPNAVAVAIAAAKWTGDL